MSGAVEVEAEVIDGELAAPGSLEVDTEAIKHDITTMNDKIQGVGELLKEYAVTESALQKIPLDEAKRHATALNKYWEAYEDSRKSLKAHLMEPYKLIESKGAELMRPVIELRDVYKAEVGGREKRRVALLRQGLELTYLDFLAANGLSKLADVVPFERVLATNPKWLNKSYGSVKAAEEIESAAADVARDWKALGALDMRYKAEAEAEFFRTLSLRSAIDLNEARTAEQDRIDALKAEVSDSRAEPQEQTRPEEADAEVRDEAVAKVYVIAVEATEEAKERLKRYMVANGIHGRMSESCFSSAEEAMKKMKEAIDG